MRCNCKISKKYTRTGVLISP